MRVIGTAGHVDHGKSTLVEALTGQHPDRLREEREREMSIVLGFAWFTLPNGEEVGIVDVPGHRDFIENMLAGVGGIDAALFVVAADEGVMPQTREHLAILDLLGVPGGVVALTKTDLAPDPEWLGLVEADLRETLAGTVLAEAPIVRVSARTGEGIPALREALQTALADCPPRPDAGRPRLPVDRVFTIAGFGTVVTGTLSNGSLHLGDEVVLLPEGVRGRVRGLQTHKRAEETALPGSRTAVNLAGVRREQVRRGDVLCLPDTYRATRRFDAHIRILPQASHPLKHNTFVKLFLGAAEVLARVRVIGQEAIPPGGEGWLQLEPQTPVVAVRGDRFILRVPSPPETIGGGTVLDAFPGRRHKRFDAAVLARLQALTDGSPEDLLAQTLESLGAADEEALARRSGLPLEGVRAALEILQSRGEARSLAGREAPPILMAQSRWEQVTSRARRLLKEYHFTFPLRPGMPREELKSRLKLPENWFLPLVAAWSAAGWLAEEGAFVRLAEHAVRLSPDEQAQADALLEAFARAPAAPPTVKECRQQAGDELYGALVYLGKLVPVSPEVVFRAEDYRRLREDLVDYLRQHGTITVAQARDRWGTSRRYVLALLEHFDSIGLTRRAGNERTLA